VRRAKSEKGLQPGQPISLRTLGEYLNLSPATISLVLNNAPGVKSIPQDTRDRVTAAAKKFDYRPSFYARSLRKRQSYTVGVLVPSLNDGYAMHVLDGVESLLIEEGYFYLTVSHHRKPDLIEEYPRLLVDRSVEGFILIDTPVEKSLNLPVVSVAGHRRVEGVTNVVLDQKRAAELALRHLYQLRVSTPELGYGPANELIQRGGDFTAIVCYNDLAAIGAIRACVNYGLRVPEDVSIVGFDDIESAAFHNPSLTTIRQPLAQMGTVAARILLQRIRGQATFPDIVPITPEIVIRESSAPPNPKRVRTKRP